MIAPTTDPSEAVLAEDNASACFFHDWEGADDLATKIVTAVAEITGKDETDVERIYRRVDPDCLNTIFAKGTNDQRRSNGVVLFSLEECTVTVYGTGFVIVQRVRDVPTVRAK